MAFSLADLVALVFLLASLVNGFRRGFILTLGHLIGILAGVLSARFWSPALAERLASLSTFGIPRGWIYIGAAILIFLLVARIILAIASLINSAYKILTIIPFLETANKIAGALLGIVVGIAFIGGLGYLLATSRIDPTVSGYFNASVIARWCQDTLFATLRPWL
ncbi:CvpA family protein [Patescibacteria group bacterium]|nr:CvpA family protein [Patescibacteria group bacterium]